MHIFYERIFAAIIIFFTALSPACSSAADKTLVEMDLSLKSKAALSQTKVLKGSDGTVVMQIDLDTPAPTTLEHKPTDFVVVLDRSGSMASDSKITYALKAIESLIDQMKSEDRFALVTFDSIVETPIDLANIEDAGKRNIISKVKAITPRGSTFLSGGLEKGMEVVMRAKKNSDGKTNRVQRLIMISDGEANVGITDTSSLNDIAKRAVKNEYAITTIGVGIDFNELLLSSLADYGAGNYHYLKNLALLDKVLADEFYAAGRVFGQDLILIFRVASGVEVIDVSGYPISRSGGVVTVQPGLIYAGQSRRLYATLKLPTHSTYTESLGSVTLNFVAVKDDGKREHSIALWKEDVTVSCVDEEKKAEVTASINREVYDNAWTANGFGTFLKNNADSIRNGDKAGASSKVKEFKKQLEQAYNQSPSPAIKQKLEEMNDVERTTDDAFTGADKDEKQKEVSKSYQSSGTTKQRVK